MAKAQSTLGQSVVVYIANTLCVMACLGAIIFTAMQPTVDSSVIAVVSGTAGTIAGSLLTIMLKATGAAEDKPDPMHDVVRKLLENNDSSEELRVNKGVVSVTRGKQSTFVTDEE